MKLYNLYESFILEEIIRNVLLNEAVDEKIIDSLIKGDPNIQGKFYYVSFDYPDKNGGIGNRWCMIDQKNLSTKGNKLVDAYQVSKNGSTKDEIVIDKRTGKPKVDENNQPVTKPVVGWRKFDIKKMSDLKVSRVPFYQPEAGFNPVGNNSPSIASTKIEDIAKFNKQYHSAAYAEKVKKKQDEKNANFQQQKQLDKQKRELKRLDLKKQAELKKQQDELKNQQELKQKEKLLKQKELDKLKKQQDELEQQQELKQKEEELKKQTELDKIKNQRDNLDDKEEDLNNI